MDDAAVLLAYTVLRCSHILSLVSSVPVLFLQTSEEGSANPPTNHVGNRIAMDVVGPLLKSRSGKQFVCDYTTRYLEAAPLHSIEELVHIFSHMKIPEEILTDQGTNFMSQLLTKAYMLLQSSLFRLAHTTPRLTASLNISIRP